MKPHDYKRYKIDQCDCLLVHIYGNVLFHSHLTCQLLILVSFVHNVLCLTLWTPLSPYYARHSEDLWKLLYETKFFRTLGIQPQTCIRSLYFSTRGSAPRPKPNCHISLSGTLPPNPQLIFMQHLLQPIFFISDLLICLFHVSVSVVFPYTKNRNPVKSLSSDSIQLCQRLWQNLTQNHPPVYVTSV